jgi:ubiquinone/menaquinone biosynthesis C-methylase UbiE
MKSHERYWEDNYSEMSEEMHGWFGANFAEPYRVYSRSLIAKMGYKTVLDGGAGFCAEYDGFAAEHPSIAYSALEITPAFVTQASERGIDIKLGSIEEMPYESDSVDCVYIRDTLRHLPEFEKAVDESLRVARYESMIVFCRPLVDDPSNEIMFNEDEGIYDNRYSQARLSAYLSSHPMVEWYYIEPISGKDGTNHLVRAFKQIGWRKKWYLRLHTRRKRYMYWTRPILGKLVRAVFGRKAGSLVKKMLRMS